jgi:iron complex outermembrane receptor protein
MNFLLFKMRAVILITAFAFVGNAQTISGTVIEGSNEAVPDVLILFNGEEIARTNQEGIFRLDSSYKLPISLELSHPDFYLKKVVLEKNDAVFRIQSIATPQNLDEVILSSTYQKESKVIIPTDKVSAQKIDEYSPLSTIAAINEIPGVYIQSGAINTNRIVIRGVGSRTLYGTNKIRAYFNGIPITNGAGDTAIDAFDPEDIANLEIVKGPKATQYGTNLGGTLLLNSKEAAPGKTFAKSNFTAGSFGLIKNNVSMATATEKLSFNVNYDHLEFDSFRENSTYNRSSLFITSNYKVTENNDLGILINYTDYNAQIASSISRTAFEEDPSQAAFTWNAAQGFEDNKQTLIGLNYTHRFTDSFSNTTSLFYTYLDHYEPRPFNILDEFTNGYGARTLFAKDFTFKESMANLSFGGEIYRDQYNWKTIENLYLQNNGNGSLSGELLSDNKEDRNNLNVFATITLPLTNKLKTQLGLNVNKTNYSFNDQFNTGVANKNADRDFDPIIAPNFNLTYDFNPATSAYFNLSRGFNYPSIEETLTPEGVINPGLGPETGFNYELGGKLYFFKSRLKVQLAAYFLDIDNLLVADRVGDDQFIGRNAGNTQHRGLELALSYTQTIFDDLTISPYLNAEISDNRFIEFVDGNSNFSGNDLTGVPDRKVNGGIGMAYKNFQLNTNFLHVGDMPLNDANSLNVEAYTVLNAKISYRNNITDHFSIELNTGINNIADAKYASSVLINAVRFGNSEPRYFYPGMPRNWFSGIKLGYTL